VAELREEAMAEACTQLSTRLTAALLRRCAEEILEEPADALAAASGPHPLVEQVGRAARAYYVYGVVRAGTAWPDDLAGVEPTTRVRLVEGRGLAALVSEVPLDEFGEAAMRGNRNDVGWLEEKALGHDEVLEAVLEQTAVVPFRLCTVFAEEEQVRTMLDREHAVLIEALERLVARAEWGVKVFVGREALEREALRRSRPDPEDEAPVWESAEELADRWALDIHLELGAIAEEALLNPLQRPELSGHRGEMLLNGVYLVADVIASDFRSAVRVLAERFARRGVEIVLTGPWPAYNFVKGSIEAAR
jgi:hypothetical protein